jgi:hypothetical protein
LEDRCKWPKLLHIAEKHLYIYIYIYIEDEWEIRKGERRSYEKPKKAIHIYEKYCKQIVEEFFF